MIDPIAAVEAVELRVGRGDRAAPHPRSRAPAIGLRIDFGPLGERAAGARLTERSRPEERVGRVVVAAVNPGTKRVAGFRSEVLVVGAPDPEGKTVLPGVDGDARPGGRRVH